LARKPGNPQKMPKTPAPKTLVPKTPAIDHDAIRELASLLDETGLTEIEYQQDGVTIRVARNLTSAGGRAHAPTAIAAEQITAPIAAAIEAAQHPGLVASPMVGTAYLGAAPGARPYVDVGTQVKAGDTLIIIEAMKTMNQIPAPRSGTIVQILVEDGQPVEYGEPLMIIE
jgi:acetyl-CoA carboxylase biotin carboxyl carrier protein